MNRMSRIAIIAVLSIFFLSALGAGSELDTAKIEALTGQKGKLDANPNTLQLNVGKC